MASLRSVNERNEHLLGSKLDYPALAMSVPSPRRHSFTDGKDVNPFHTPDNSSSNSKCNSPSPLSRQVIRAAPSTYFRSRRIRKADIEKPWLKSNDDHVARWQTLFPALGLLAGFCLAAFMAYSGWTSIPNHEYCSVLDEDFSSSMLNTNVWTKEAEVGGFGNGQFEQTTVTNENVYIENQILHIKPTLQDQHLVESDNTINLLDQGVCSSDTWANCVSTTNTTNGTIVQPAKSGRINTKSGASIKFGRVEIIARMPSGDWLWPAIWMLPVNNVYGQWPKSGEIDIAESRGNNHTYSLGGSDTISSALHWGPDKSNDAYWRTYGKSSAKHYPFNHGFHTFGLEWSEKYIYMYLDTRLLQVLYTKFDRPLWSRGGFPLSSSNGTSFVDPWAQAGDLATPFNENFYLILNVAVGSTNGWFKDGIAGKPWVDTSPTAKQDFWNARDQWYPTWTQPAMQVKSVKMWQQRGYNGC